MRIEAAESERVKRGFVFTAGIDDGQTECGLDHVKHDFIFKNNSKLEMEHCLQKFLKIYFKNLVT